ncbi:MAG: hypothetical protein NUV86_02410 [Candidatus Scalindua sp.]|nr:hypothetical protein [Candidatus Scalindua sp.]
MEGKCKYLVVVDIPGIKEYVFGTDKIVEIRGASTLLKRVNEEFILKFLSEDQKLPVNKVFAGGGSGHFIVEAEEMKLVEALSKLKVHVLKESKGGFSIVSGYSEYFEEKYDESQRNAHFSLEKDKDENPFSYAVPIHTGYIRECERCSGEASTFKKFHKEDADLHALCVVCAQKLISGKDKKSGPWKEFSGYLRDRGFDCRLPKDFEEIGAECRAKKGYTALVYADGNDMGKIFQKIKKREEYESISNMIEKSVRDACWESIIEVSRIETYKQKNNVLPAAILLMGGDDLLVYLAADIAIPFAISVANKFSEKARAHNLSLSLGISFGKSHTPISIMVNQAEELLRSAKKSRLKNNQQNNTTSSEAYIDYHLASDFNQIDVQSSRLNHLTLEGNYRTDSERYYLKLYQKPYSLSELKVLWDSANNLLQSGIASTKLRQFGYAPTLGKMNGTLEFLRTFTRLNYEQRGEITKALSKFCGKSGEILWREQKDENCDTTVLMDLIELTEFIKKT